MNPNSLSLSESLHFNRSTLSALNRKLQLTEPQIEAHSPSVLRIEALSSCTLSSSGKSSVLESIVGKDFLPRGSATVRKEISDEIDRETSCLKGISSVQYFICNLIFSTTKLMLWWLKLIFALMVRKFGLVLSKRRSGLNLKPQGSTLFDTTQLVFNDSTALTEDDLYAAKLLGNLFS
ncbi:hypothetical protein P8452_27001 [Trifolium repens]|nr:hypothetical protein P8452_27001 [Trifolium repens]